MIERYPLMIFSRCQYLVNQKWGRNEKNAMNNSIPLNSQRCTIHITLFSYNLPNRYRIKIITENMEHSKFENLLENYQSLLIIIVVFIALYMVLHFLKKYSE